MTERENFLIAYNHGKPEWTPCFFDVYQPMGSSLLNNNGEFMKGGLDMFGVNWLVTPDTGYQAIADPREHLFDDITRWQEFVHFPDLDAMDWESGAAMDLKDINREEKMVTLFGIEGNYLRLQSMMGICETMIAMVEEPEAVYSFFNAYTDFKIHSIKKIAQYYKPDIYVDGDDVCYTTGLFFSKELYKQLIKPFEMRVGKAVLDCGMILEHHLCGKCEDLIPDIIDRGATIWQPAQSMNDLVGIQRQYGDRLLIHGGWDSYGPHNRDDATEKQVRAEVRRCINEYGSQGNFALFPVMLGDPADGRLQKKREWVSDECHNYRV